RGYATGSCYVDRGRGRVPSSSSRDRNARYRLSRGGERHGTVRDSRVGGLGCISAGRYGISRLGNNRPRLGRRENSGKCCPQAGQIKRRRCARRPVHHNLHYGTGIGTVSRQRRRGATNGGCVKITRVVVVAQIEGWHRSRRVVIEDQGTG